MLAALAEFSDNGVLDVSLGCINRLIRKVRTVNKESDEKINHRGFNWQHNGIL